MDGEDLYDFWAKEMNGQNIEVDSWDEIGEEDRNAWNALAVMVEG